jgi:hypothetical protein
MTRVTIFLLAGWTLNRGLLKMLDVDAHGAGHVGKSFADSITILLQVINCLMPKTITMVPVAQKKRDLQRRPTVAGGTTVTVTSDGKCVCLMRYYVIIILAYNNIL